MLVPSGTLYRSLRGALGIAPAPSRDGTRIVWQGTQFHSESLLPGHRKQGSQLTTLQRRKGFLLVRCRGASLVALGGWALRGASEWDVLSISEF